jgi:hypothetical protein
MEPTDPPLILTTAPLLPPHNTTTHEPKCCDVTPGIPGNQVWYCDTQSGWYPNQTAVNEPNPSNEVCCLVRDSCSKP